MKIEFNFNKFMADSKVKNIKELADITGLNYGTLRNISGKKRTPSIKICYLLCHELNKNPNDYIKKEGDKSGTNGINDNKTSC